MAITFLAPKRSKSMHTSFMSSSRSGIVSVAHEDIRDIKGKVFGKSMDPH